MNRCIQVLLILVCLVSSAYCRARIIGGSLEKIRNVPYQVSLRYDERHFCGGVIIKERVILSAGHCAFQRVPSRISIRVGSNYWLKGGVIGNVTSTKIHPKFSRRTLSFDLSLMFLRTALQFSASIKSVPLNNQRLLANTRGVISGWGTRYTGGNATDQLLSAQIQVISQRICTRIFGGKISRSMFCAGTLSGAKDACQGDSGGPCVANGRLVGVISWGNGCGKRGYPGIYTKVRFTRTWIVNNS